MHLCKERSHSGVFAAEVFTFYPLNQIGQNTSNSIMLLFGAVLELKLRTESGHAHNNVDARV